MELVAFGHPLDRRELTAVRLRGQQRARLHRLPVQEHGAGAAARRVASDVRAGEPEGLAEEVHEERAGLDIGLSHRPVDGDRDVGHGVLLLAPFWGLEVGAGKQPECRPGAGSGRIGKP